MVTDCLTSASPELGIGNCCSRRTGDVQYACRSWSEGHANKVPPFKWVSKLHNQFDWQHKVTNTKIYSDVWAKGSLRTNNTRSVGYIFTNSDIAVLMTEIKKMDVEKYQCDRCHTPHFDSKHIDWQPSTFQKFIIPIFRTWWIPSRCSNITERIWMYWTCECCNESVPCLTDSSVSSHNSSRKT